MSFIVFVSRIEPSNDPETMTIHSCVCHQTPKPRLSRLLVSEKRPITAITDP